MCYYALYTLLKTNALIIQLLFIAIEIRRFALVAMLLLIEHNFISNRAVFFIEHNSTF